MGNLSLTLCGNANSPTSSTVNWALSPGRFFPYKAKMGGFEYICIHPSGVINWHFLIINLPMAESYLEKLVVLKTCIPQ